MMERSSGASAMLLWPKRNDTKMSYEWVLLTQ